MAFVGCFAYRSSSQSIADSTETAITWDSEDYDTSTIHNTSTNPSRFTVPTGHGGYWRFVFAISWLDDFTTSGVTITYRIKKNGSTFIQQSTVMNETTNNKPLYVVEATLNLVTGDYVELAIEQNDGAARSIHGSATRRSFAIAEFAGA